jgi:hypothetical protein
MSAFTSITQHVIRIIAKMKMAFGFLMGVDITSTMLALVFFSFLGLGVFLMLRSIFRKLQKEPDQKTKTIVFLTLFLTPLILLLLLAAAYLPFQQYSENARAKAYSEADSLRELLNSPISSVILPTGIRLDTITYTDSITNTEVYSLIPVSGIPLLDAAVKSAIEDERKNFLAYVQGEFKRDTTLYGYGGEFTSDVLSAYKNDKIISYLFSINYYHAGAAHPIANYYSYNFYIPNNKRVTFRDYFSAPTKSDTTLLTKLITKSIDREGISLAHLYEMDFAVTGDSILFAFDDYELASYSEGVIEASVSRKELNNNIREAYRGAASNH